MKVDEISNGNEFFRELWNPNLEIQENHLLHGISLIEVKVDVFDKVLTQY